MRWCRGIWVPGYGTWSAPTCHHPNMSSNRPGAGPSPSTSAASPSPRLQTGGPSPLPAHSSVRADGERAPSAGSVASARRTQTPVRPAVVRSSPAAARASPARLSAAASLSPSLQGPHERASSGLMRDVDAPVPPSAPGAPSVDSVTEVAGVTPVEPVVGASSPPALPTTTTTAAAEGGHASTSTNALATPLSSASAVLHGRALVPHAPTPLPSPARYAASPGPVQAPSSPSTATAAAAAATGNPYRPPSAFSPGSTVKAVGSPLVSRVKVDSLQGTGGQVPSHSSVTTRCRCCCCRRCC